MDTPYEVATLEDWCRAHRQPFMRIAAPNYTVAQQVSIPGLPEKANVVFERPGAFVARLANAAIIPSDGVACTEDGKLLYQGLTARDDKPQLALGPSCSGIDGNGRFLVNTTPSSVVEDDCIFFGGKANFGHFIFENLLRLPLLNWLPQLQTLPIAVYDDLPRRFYEFLEIFGFGEDRRIRIARSSATRFASVWMLSAPLHRKTPKSKPALLPDVIWAARSATAYLSAGFDGPRPRWYLARTAAIWRRLVNENSVVEQLSSFGIRVLDISGLGAEDQIRAVSNAELIVLPAGATGAITLFAAVDCAVIELMPADVSAVFGSLGFAGVVGRPYHRIIGRRASVLEAEAAGLPPSAAALKSDEDYLIDIDELRGVLTIADGYCRTKSQF